MALANINQISGSGAILDTDICITRVSGVITNRLFSDVKAYVNGTTGLINNTDSFLFADKNTGHAKWVTGSQLKAYLFGSNGLISDNDFISVIRSGAAYAATGTQMKTYSNVTLFTPADLTNLYAWYDISDAATRTVSGSDLVGLQDKSPNALHLDTSSGGIYPQFHSSGGANNKAYAKMVSQSDLHSSVTIPTPGTEMTVYIVYKVNSLPTIIGFLNCFDPNERTSIQFYDDGNGQGHKIDFSAYINGHAQGYKNTNNGSWQFCSFSWSSVKNRTIHVSNEPYPNRFFGFDTYNTQPLTEFLRIGLGINAFQVGMDVDQCEMILVKEVVSLENDILIRNYLQNKYSIASTPSIMFFGDSITYGYGTSDPLSTSYPALTAANKGKYCHNLGYNSSDVVTPGSWSDAGTLTGIHFNDLIYQLQTDQYDYSGISHIVATYGTNDSVAITGPSDVAAWKATFKGEVIKLHTMTGVPYSRIILGTAPYQSSRPNTPALATATGEICAELGAVFCDFYTPTQAGGGDALLSDGLHPTDAGHLIMANTLTPLLT